MRGMRSVAALAVAALIGVAYAQSAGQAPPTAGSDLLAYAAFQSDLSELAAMELKSEADVDAALDYAARHDRDALVRGWMSYAADVAAQSPAFVESLRAAERRWGRNSSSRITSNRGFARTLPGSEDATRLVLDTLASDAARVAAVAGRHRAFAYALRDQPWGGAVASGQDARRQRVRALGRPGTFTPVIAPAAAANLAVGPLSIGNEAGDSAFGRRHFWDALTGREPVMHPAATPPAATASPWRAEANPETIDAVLSVAALRVLGAQASQSAAISHFLRDPRAASCVEMARLQFHSCLSAARFVYENEYCLAQHGLRDLAMCISAPIRRDEAYMAAFAAQETPAAEFILAAAESAPEALVQETVAQEAAAVEVTSLPGTADMPTASPVVEVQALAAPPAPVAVVEAAAAIPSAGAMFAATLSTMGAGELFARADELDEQGRADQARMARRSLIARFPDSPLALLAAQRLANGRQN